MFCAWYEVMSSCDKEMSSPCTLQTLPLQASVVPGEQVNYFPSRFDPVRHAERYPGNPAQLTGRREKRMIPKENNFKQVLWACRSLPGSRCWVLIM